MLARWRSQSRRGVAIEELEPEGGRRSLLMTCGAEIRSGDEALLKMAFPDDDGFFFFFPPSMASFFPSLLVKPSTGNSYQG